MSPEGKSLSIFLSTAEVSGDIAGADLASALRRAYPGVRLFGCGGHKMADAGVSLDVNTTDFGVIGLFEVFRFIPRLFRAFFKIRQAVKRERPQLAVLIGYEGFHVPLARWFRRQGIYTVSYMPPQVWLWAALARPIARSYDEILAVVPDEVEIYGKAGANVSFVGHYLRDKIPAARRPEARSELRRRLGLDDSGTVIALLPGSRRHEVGVFAPILLSAASLLLTRQPQLTFVLAVADECFRPFIEDAVRKQGLAGQVVLTDGSRDSMAVSDLVLLASGTATLEAALFRLPMVIVYRLSRSTVGVVRALQFLGVIRYDHIALPNLLLQGPIVPELHQGEASPDKIAQAAEELLSDPVKYRRMQSELARVRPLLGEGKSTQKAAELLLERAVGQRSAARGLQVSRRA